MKPSATDGCWAYWLKRALRSVTGSRTYTEYNKVDVKITAMLKLIKNEGEYKDALGRVYNLMQMDLADDSPELDELEALSLFIEHYEDKHYPIALPSPIDAITFRLEQLGKEKSELAKILGTRARQSEILSGKRKLSLEMIRKLHAILGIPAESLIAAY